MPAQSPQGNKYRLVIVDDEEFIVNELADYFREEGFDVWSAIDGQEGIKAIAQRKPDICLIDLKLPDMSGLSVLKAAKEIVPTTKVVVNTGYVDQELVEQATALKCDFFLHKPFDLLELKRKVEELLAS